MKSKFGEVIKNQSLFEQQKNSSILNLEITNDSSYLMNLIRLLGLELVHILL